VRLFIELYYGIDWPERKNMPEIAFTLTLLEISLALLIFGLIGTYLVIRDTQRKKGRWGINSHFPKRCPHCGNKYPLIRIPADFEQAMWGGMTCQRCGYRIDKWGKEITKE
jgi:DNA-directed RNA polymerase subunit RPC12/RpoP